jgi:hypothetical protein
MEGILAIVFIFGGGSMFLLAISPVGRAIANRIQERGRPSSELAERLETGHQAVLDELEVLRHDVVEMQERMDFAERMLAQHRQQAPLPAGDPDRGGGGAEGGRR